MSRNLVIAVVVIVLLVLVGWYLTRPKQTVAPQAPTAPPIASAGAQMKEEVGVVTISQSEFSPKNITIKVGDSVTWMNSDSANHTVNSDPHPTHTLFSILNKVGLIKAGEKKSLQFTTAGTFTYHDHLNPSLMGSVTVQ